MNSKRTRVQPVFGWLRQHAGSDWPATLLRLATGLAIEINPGPLVSANFTKEITVPASPTRLAWMIRNSHRLVPQDGRRWKEYRQRVTENPKLADTLAALDSGQRDGLPKKLVLEGKTHCDCLLECERAVIWVEGKRNDWLAPNTKWDVTRDQLARNLEACWLLTRQKQKQYCLLVCHEHALKYHEELLIAGYRTGTWVGGWPHLDETTRQELGKRIATLTWSQIAAEWPGLRECRELIDLD